MGDRSGIEWCDATWNPISGCTKVSAGCARCYAERVFPRAYPDCLCGHMRFAHDENGFCRQCECDGFARRQFPDVRFHEDRLEQPLHWRKPRRVFVNSMSDLFHENVTDEQIAAVFSVMALSQQHTFQILTKRHERLYAYMNWLTRNPDALLGLMEDMGHPASFSLPLPNVWLGVSCEDQKTADERIPLLLQTPAAVRFVSAEPLLGPIDFSSVGDGRGYHYNALIKGPPFGHFEHDARLDWVIVGGESGPGARPIYIAWVRSIVRQCRAASVPVFFKQAGANVLDRNDAGFDAPWNDGRGWPVNADGSDRGTIELDPQGYQGAPVRVVLKDRKGGDPREWPEDLRVREFPNTRSE